MSAIYSDTEHQQVSPVKSQLISGGYKYFLHFGSFHPYDLYQNETMTVTWPDGTVDCITFTYNRDKSIEQSTINGGESEYFNYFFLKKRCQGMDFRVFTMV